MLATHERIDGVVCFDEARIEATAELATALGLPTSGVQAVTRCRDKWQTRQAIYRTSVARWRRYEPWLGPLRALVDV